MHPRCRHGWLFNLLEGRTGDAIGSPKRWDLGEDTIKLNSITKRKELSEEKCYSDCIQNVWFQNTNKCQVTGDGAGSASSISPNWLSCFIGDGVGTGSGVSGEGVSEITHSELDSSTKVSFSCSLGSSCLGFIFFEPQNSPTCFWESRESDRIEMIHLTLEHKSS